ncbi:MAG: DUF3500 domain-containing protein [Planctomycetia bacterium]|nr:DUF3500 domain-containing protein [Planctomycetia bacterium]
MTPRQLLVIAALLVGLTGVAVVARKTETSGERLTDRAMAFLASLKPEQKPRAAFAFDDPERFHWWFTPQQKAGKPTRKGLPLEDMSDEQKKIALEMLAAGTSDTGFKRATTIMGLENLLLDLEKGKGPVRNVGWYFVSVFGTPSKTGKWGCRIEGHHLSLSFTVDSGRIISATPNVFASNPAEIMAGKRKGERPLGETIDQYRAMLAALTKEQQTIAKQPKLFPEIKENESKPSVGAPVGLSADKMTEAQQTVLWKLIEAYAGRMPTDVATAEMNRIKEAGISKVTFAYGGGDAAVAGIPYSYRIQGPTFLIEFLNEQGDSAKNPANHIHSAWRTIGGDFGIASR